LYLNLNILYRASDKYWNTGTFAIVIKIG